MLQYGTGFSFTLFTFGALALAQQSEACHEKYNLYLIQHTNKSLTIFGTADCSVGAWPGIFCMYGMKFMKTAAKNYDNSRTTVPLSLWVLDSLSLSLVAGNSREHSPELSPWLIYGDADKMLAQVGQLLSHCESLALDPSSSSSLSSSSSRSSSVFNLSFVCI